ncbi:MAG TPA: alkaline phosphatase family protein [Acidimicrobiales bacterium]|nr:alkaline phosphatase family protein [Acidimicrobiales bacterium]
MEENLRTRREILAAGMAGGISLLLASCGGATAKKAASIKPAGSDLEAVEHVVFLMHENRSFDHYFGTYRGVRGFDDARARRAGLFSQAWPGGSAPELLPFHLDTATSKAECTLDLSHQWDAQHQCWNGGKMDSWVSVHTEQHWEGPENGVLTMGYYTRQDLSFYYSLADAFTICDGYHCSVMGPTHPNRLHALSGTLDPAGLAGGPVVFTNSAPTAQGSATWSTMPEALENAGVSWKVYNAPGSGYQPSSGVAMAISDNILLYFKQFMDPSSALYQKAFGPVFPNDFVSDIANDRLPQVSWITPPNGYDEHPPSAPALGMWFSHSVISALVSNPKVWSKTVLFIMYDENDGFFDHVAPPTPPPGTAGEYLTTDPLPLFAFGIAGPVGLGFRVPMLVVSPFSRGGYVCSDTFDHTSQMRFLETRFGVKAPNISAWRRSVTGDLTTTLHVTSPDASIPTLPATAGKSDPVVGSECTSGQLFEIDVKNPAPYPLPAHQEIPHQEPGKARRITV